MDGTDALLLLGLGGLLWYAWTTGAFSSLETGVETVEAATIGWQNVNDGPTWVPVINESEAAVGIPQDLLARQAYQESHFRTDVITGATASPAGALGIMQLEPAYYPSVTVPTPFTAADTTQQISDAAAAMAGYYQQFSDWGLALAAYNAGPAAVQAYLSSGTALPPETQTYVADILTDVPQQTVLTLNA